MTTRGERIRKARTLRRPKMTQLDLALETGVGQRTIGRIEKGEAETSPSLAVLEDYFGISDQEGPGREGTAPSQLAARGDNPRIKDASVMELLAELTTRFARMDAHTAARPSMRPERLRWYTEDAPSAARERAEGEPERGEAL